MEPRALASRSSSGIPPSESWEVNTSAASGEDKITAKSAVSPLRSAQIRGVVSVQQGSLIHKACRYVQRASMWVVCWQCCGNCTWMCSCTVRTTLSHDTQQFAAVKTTACGLRGFRSRNSVCRSARRDMQAAVQGACTRERACAEKRGHRRACRS